MAAPSLDRHPVERSAPCCFAPLPLCLSALPTLAEPICNPARGTGLSVMGVASNDTLNLRAAPSASAALIARIGPRETGVTATGGVAWSKGGLGQVP